MKSSSLLKIGLGLFIGLFLFLCYILYQSYGYNSLLEEYNVDIENGDELIDYKNGSYGVLHKGDQLFKCKTGGYEILKEDGTQLYLCGELIRSQNKLEVEINFTI